MLNILYYTGQLHDKESSAHNVYSAMAEKPWCRKPSLGSWDTWVPNSVMILTHCGPSSLVVFHLHKMARLSDLCVPI